MHGIYNVFEKAADRLGIEIQPGGLRKRAPSNVLSKDAREFVDGLIKEDPELQKIRRKNIYDTVKDLQNERGGFMYDDVKKLMDKLKQRAVENVDLLEGVSSMYEEADPDLDKEIAELSGAEALPPVRHTRSSSQREAMSKEKKSSGKEKKSSGKGLTIMQPKQMMARLPVLMAQVRAGNNSKTLLNEIKQMAYSLLRGKHITKPAYNKILNFVKNI